MKLSLLVGLLLISGALVAQSRPIRGTVRAKTDKQPLSGSSVIIKGTSTGTTTSAGGSFTLTAPDQSVTLVITAIAHLTKEVVVARNVDSVTVVLIEDGHSLAEVVVTGYGTVAKRDMTGAVSTRGISPVSKASRRPSPRAGSADAWEVKTTSATGGKSTDATPSQKPGVLTAGEIHDFSKWTLWQGIARHDLNQWRALWNVQPLTRYTVQLITADGFPVVDAPVILKNGQQQTLWSARSDNTGKGELWASPFDSTVALSDVRIEALVNGKTYEVRKPVVFAKGTNTLTVRESCASGGAVDIAFVVDATGSMGDEIRFLQAELSDVMSNVKKQLTGVAVRSGSVFYRDVNDEYLTRTSDLTTDNDSTVRFVNQQSAGGGGDYPEAVEQALDVAITKLSWSAQAKARLLFLVLDAPPHNSPAILKSLHETMQRAAALGIRIIPIGASGIDKSTEYLLRSMALTTNGTYVFLTDDSGVGDAHIKPTTDQYTVELLNALLVRLVTKFTQTPECRQVALESTAVNAPENTLVTDTTAVLTEDGSVMDKNPAFTLYPNPTRDVLHVSSEGVVKEVFVLDVTGKIVLRRTPNERNFALTLTDYPTGVYFLRVSTGKTWKTSRFVLNR